MERVFLAMEFLSKLSDPCFTDSSNYKKWGSSQEIKNCWKPTSRTR